MDPIVENEAKLHITNGIEKASSSTGVDIKVSHHIRSLGKIPNDSLFLCVQQACRLVKE